MAQEKLTDGELRHYQRIMDRMTMPEKMKAVFDPRRYHFYYGGRGGAKSVSVAKYLLQQAAKNKLRILCTREIQNSIKDSVHSLLKDLIQELGYVGYEVTETMIRHIKTGSEFIFSGLYGQDKRQSLKSYANIDICWVEEAQAVSKGSLQLLDPTIRKPGSRMIFTFNRLFPHDPIWRFQELIPDSDKVLVLTNYSDNPFLPDELAAQAARSKAEYDAGISDDYLHIWLGEPVGFSEKTIIPMRDIRAAIDRKITDEGGIEVGVDVARYGTDRTQFFMRKGLKIIKWQTHERQSLIETAHYLIDFIGKSNTGIPLKIDDTGLGGGLTDYMESKGYNVIPVSFGASAKDPDKYSNCISEMWFEFKELLPKISIPDIPELHAELCSREWSIDNKSRRRVESKDDYKKRGHRSPDLADALLLCYYALDYEPVFTRGL